MADNSTSNHYGGLTPSQALSATARPYLGPKGEKPAHVTNGEDSSSGQPKSSNGNSNNNKKQRSRRKKGGNQQEASGETAGDEDPNAPSRNPKAKQQRGGRNQAQPNGDNGGDVSNEANGTARNPPKGRQQQQQQQRGNKKGNKGKNAPQTRAEDANNPNQNPPGKKNKPKRKRFPWRRFIPQGTVDPITLENLVSLPYPPFALVANAPYTTVPVWPIPEGNQEPPNEEKQIVDVEELNRRRIAEQWGQSLVSKSDETKEDDETPSVEPAGKRHYNLYDGRALAYYIVSQLQFIDPLNRRDLTRPELLNLDNYLRRHGFKDLKVTDAYDAKGITISSAGAAAATAQGRADILQQMASNLLNSLFGGHSVSNAPTPRPTSSSTSALQDQYAALRIQEEQHARQQEEQRQQQQYGEGGPNGNASPFGEAAVYASEDGGLMIIDDDENPGLRGGDYSAANRGNSYSAANYQNANPFYSASHISNRYGGGGGAISGTTDAFPALAGAPVPAAQPVPAPVSNKPAPKKPSNKTLSRITGAVKKTDPDESQRQWEAREDARKRAMLANLSFGNINSAAFDASQSLLKPPPGMGANAMVSDAILERNKAFADALGVKPATMRQQLNSGWTRPTEGKHISLDEFGNELNAAIYPEALIAAAREQTGLVLKLEKKWKAFLADDKAASIPLNPMEKKTRIIVHHYSDFWNLRTESFDPEPKRYIHCVKMLDTHMPHPLLSDVARNWRGPPPQGRLGEVRHNNNTSQQTAGQSTKSREIPPPPERVPLPLKPRSLAPGEQKADRIPLTTEEGVTDSSNARFGSLFDGRERPKLELAKRTVPREIPEFEPEKGFDFAADRLEREVKQEEKARKEREAADEKRRALEDAFASDDEGGGQSSGSEWEEPEALYTGSDIEE
jgi:hypothetical protein